MLESAQNHLPALACGKTFFLKTGPWCQKGWGWLPLQIMKLVPFLTNRAPKLTDFLKGPVWVYLNSTCNQFRVSNCGSSYQSMCVVQKSVSIFTSMACADTSSLLNFMTVHTSRHMPTESHAGAGQRQNTQASVTQ